ncbi:dihydroneopterin aldolase [Natronobacillus azotifigens]|uniref:7,8-dihydroneopterin aldolase n=1 Tax=Natronobacillus azotifigens TaxID=472978 RepID=A0A9J6RCX8_9BACI|nr:dihydroneopterin aldolase [Natronobacillus azotifigens]MCZ0703570.1 dihydroneopterin aldolase [Natronobacillus azotifigens]
MDKIYLNRLSFYGYHGLFKAESELGQRFYVDLELELDLKPAGISDEMEDSINYGEVYQLTKEVVEGERLSLIEAVAEKISAQLLSNFAQLTACRVKVVKPDPPIPGHYESVAVEIYRVRS